MSEYLKEKRRYLRGETNFEGYYWKHSSQGAFGKVEKATVIDLSTGGCRLSVSNNHDRHYDDSITLTFKLNNVEHTKIQKEAVVCRIDGNNIGCRFLSEYDKDIWFYFHGDKKSK
jgi:hypothetical protein